jgi:cysteine dioxygenase
VRPEQLLIVWRPGAESRIHDHTRHCLMRVLRGALRETVFRFPDEALLRRGSPAPPAVERRRVLREGEVGYISSGFSLSCTLLLRGRFEGG